MRIGLLFIVLLFLITPVFARPSRIIDGVNIKQEKEIMEAVDEGWLEAFLDYIELEEGE